MTIIARELLSENIVTTDRIIAEASAEAELIARAMAAPLSYAEMRELNQRQQLGARLAGMDAATLRLQAIRFLVERAEATGAAWGWGQVAEVAARFARLVEAWRAEQRALVQADLASALHGEVIDAGGSHNEERAAREAHLERADVYFERRAAREGLERAVFADAEMPADLCGSAHADDCPHGYGRCVRQNCIACPLWDADHGTDDDDDDEPTPAPRPARLPKAEIRTRMRDHKRADIAARRQLAPRSGRRAVRGW